MIGRFDLAPPPIDDELSQMVESHRSKTNQYYAAILFFGLWGTADCSPEVRLYAAYRHLESNPENGPAWLETARVHMEAGEPATALAIVDELLRLGNPGLYPGIYSEDPEAVRAHFLADSGEYDRALDAFDAIRARHGDSPVYRYALGTVLHAKGDYADAEAAYDEALAGLEDLRLEAEEEDMTEELGIDFESAADYIRAARREAEAGQPFSGERPLDLLGFRDE